MSLLVERREEVQNAIPTENLYDELRAFVQGLPEGESAAATDILRFVALVLSDNRIVRQLAISAIGYDDGIQDWLPTFAGHLDDALVARALETSVLFHEQVDMGSSSSGALFHHFRNRMTPEQGKRLSAAIVASKVA